MCVPCEINLEHPIQSSYQGKTVNQSSNCRMLLNEGNSKYESCRNFEKSNESQIRIKEKTENTPAKLNAPLSKTNPSRVNLALKEQRGKCAELTKKTSEMQEQINLIGVEVTAILKDDIHELMENNLDVVLRNFVIFAQLCNFGAVQLCNSKLRNFGIRKFLKK